MTAAVAAYTADMKTAGIINLDKKILETSGLKRGITMLAKDTSYAAKAGIVTLRYQKLQFEYPLVRIAVPVEDGALVTLVIPAAYVLSAFEFESAATAKKLGFRV